MAHHIALCTCTGDDNSWDSKNSKIDDEKRCCLYVTNSTAHGRLITLSQYKLSFLEQGRVTYF